MAEIPVEKKSSLAWLPWLLLAAGLLAVAWYFIAENDREIAASQDAAEETYPAGSDMTGMAEEELRSNAQGQTILTGMTGLESLGTMIGRDVELSGVAVNRVVGDEAFTIGEGTRETLVMFDEARTPNTAMEGNVDVNPGSRVTVSGNVRAFPGDAPTNVAEVIDTSATAMIFASSVETVE